MSVWIIDDQGRIHPLRDSWKPRFFLALQTRATVNAARQILRQSSVKTQIRVVERKEFYRGAAVPVLEVRVENPLRYMALVDKFQRANRFELFNCDIHMVQAFHYERGHFPLARGEFEIDGAGVLRGWRLNDSPWDLDYNWPPLRFAYLSSGERGSDPNHSRPNSLLLTLGQSIGEGTSYFLDSADSRELLTSLNKHLSDWDPDVLLSGWGDSYIFPRLVLMSKKCGIPLGLSRDLNRGVQGKAGRSFFTYGRTIYQGGAQYLFGRWHLDVENSFLLKQTGLDGLFEIARIAQIPVQRAARSTIGTSLSSMQLSVAESDGFLIPLHKQQTEDFREGTDLVVADKGGLVYEPEVGWHEQVAELDFESMYPSIMARFNVSPETVNCVCCPENHVPEIGHHLCKKRRGLVPRVLEKILDKRSRYKSLHKTTRDPLLKERYRNLYTAHKWALVTCFGYLGFKNARFGKIEAHECVNAYGRELFLQAKDIAESRGFHFVHGIVDSLWIKRKGATKEDYSKLAAEISRVTGFPLTLEGVYQWICFCPSKQDKELGVPNRYFGCFESGELKIRGLELRRHDTPPLFKALQEELLICLTKADTLKECLGLIPELEEIRRVYRERIKIGKVSLPELAFSSTLSKGPSAYVHATFSSIAARQLEAAGIQLHAGETIQYVISSAKDKVKDWRVTPLALAGSYTEYDVNKYLELLERAYLSVLEELLRTQGNSRLDSPACNLTRSFSLLGHHGDL